MATDVTGVIRKRLREIDDELKGFETLQAEKERLTRALGELDAAEERPRRGRRTASPGRPRKRATARRGAKRAPRGSNQEAIIGHVTANPGATTPEIASATGIDRAVIYSAVSRLATAGRLRKQPREDGQVAYEIAEAAE